MTVHLVGAGPGDPGLITAKGLELLRRCDALVYDRLVSSELVAEASEDAIRIDRERLTQPQINDLLVRLGRAELEVVRLKGGDPFVFGRGGEEAIALAEANVPFEVVPGVSALAAVPAAADIPITHRGVASQVTFVAAHEPDELDLDTLAEGKGTLVLFMGLAALAETARRLVRAGRSPDTPAAVISKGTTPEQHVVRARLSDIADAASGLEPPALVVVGDVVAVAERLSRPTRSGRRRARSARAIVPSA
jgi:uroporphyrin-III C-methyltransferase